MCVCVCVCVCVAYFVRYVMDGTMTLTERMDRWQWHGVYPSLSVMLVIQSRPVKQATKVAFAHVSQGEVVRVHITTNRQAGQPAIRVECKYHPF